MCCPHNRKDRHLLNVCFIIYDTDGKSNASCGHWKQVQVEAEQK